MSGKALVYWDTCIFLARLKNEVNKGAEAMRHIDMMLEQARLKKLIIVTSSLTIAEVLSIGIDEKSESTFRNWMSPNVREISVQDATTAVMYRARELRESIKLANVKQLGKTLSVPDAIHLATAQINGINKFYTFDGITPTAKRDQNIKLLCCEGYVQTVKIVKPYAESDEQLSLESDM